MSFFEKKNRIETKFEKKNKFNANKNNQQKNDIKIIRRENQNHVVN